MAVGLEFALRQISLDYQEAASFPHYQFGLFSGHLWCSCFPVFDVFQTMAANSLLLLSGGVY